MEAPTGCSYSSKDGNSSDFPTNAGAANFPSDNLPLDPEVPTLIPHGMTYSETVIDEAETTGLSNVSVSTAPSAPTSLRLKMYRYDSIKLVEVMLSVDGTEKYSAISHVWGKFERISIPGVNGKVLASKEKAKFIREDLAREVGEGNIFWMDILCVNQDDPDARIAVTQHIPAIFRFAAKTIVVRESAGFQKCCAAAIGGGLRDVVNIQLEMRDHHEAVHQGNLFAEPVLERLWPLQEVLLSNCLSFVQCRAITEDNYTQNKSEMSASNTLTLLTKLWSLANAWSHPMQPDSADLRPDFMHSFLKCSVVTRIEPGTRTMNRHLPDALMYHMNSERRTTKPRDFILAIMPQYEFYIVPQNAKQMKFGQIFLDCCHQMEAAKTTTTPLFLVNIDVRRINFAATDQIPEPVYLGDFVKLFLGTKPRLLEHPVIGNPLGRMRGYSVKVKHPYQFIAKPNHRFVLALIIQSMRDSATLWHNAILGEIQIYARDMNGEIQARQGPESAILPQFSKLIAARIFANISASTERHGLSIAPATIVTKLLEDNKFNEHLKVVSPYYLLLLAAMINCGVGLSAIDWAICNFDPLLVTFSNRLFLALSRMEMVFQGRIPAEIEYYLVETHPSESFNVTPSRLIARYPGHSEFHMCLFPNLHAPLETRSEA